MFIRPGFVFMSETGGGGGEPPPPPLSTGGSAPPPAVAGGTTAAPPPAFAELLPEDIRDAAAFRDIRDLPSLAKSYLNATKLIGARPEDVIRLPTNPDDADAWAQVHARLGRPETPDKYEFQRPELPKGLTVDEKLEGGFKELAHKLGLNARQAADLYGWYNQQTVERFTGADAARTQAATAARDALKAEWGAAFDQKLEDGEAALKHYGGDEFAAYLMETGLKDDPRLVRMLANMGGRLREDGIIGKGTQGGAGPLSPAEARQQINGLRGDAEFMKGYMDAKHPNHAAAMAKMEQLHTFAYPPAA